MASLYQKLHREDELEAITCEECGSGNVFDSPPSCKSCTEWRILLAAKGVTSK